MNRTLRSQASAGVFVVIACFKRRRIQVLFHHLVQCVLETSQHESDGRTRSESESVCLGSYRSVCRGPAFVLGSIERLSGFRLQKFVENYRSQRGSSRDSTFAIARGFGRRTIGVLSKTARVDGVVSGILHVAPPHDKCARYRSMSIREIARASFNSDSVARRNSQSALPL